MTMSLGTVQRQYEEAMQLPEGSERDRALSMLMDYMKSVFNIPLMQNENWEREHKAVIAMYRKISMSRSFEE